jgi:hypothetical protein
MPDNRSSVLLETRRARSSRGEICISFPNWTDRIPHRQHRGRTAHGARARDKTRPRGDGFGEPDGTIVLA